MKIHSLALLFCVLFGIVVIGSFSCKKINESTELGGNLIPGVDNINTFEQILSTQTNNVLYNDTTKLFYSDNVAVGSLNDAEFGASKADAYFNVSISSNGNFPFNVDRANVNDPNYLKIDSVVLSLAYTGAFGDSNAQQTLHVFEIANDQSFIDTVLYPFNRPAFSTAGSELGSATYIPSQLKDSVFIQKTGKVGDTARVGNVLRIKFNDNSLAQRFANYDTVAGLPNSGFANDSTFRTLFRGFAIKAGNPSGNGSLSYFNLSDAANTKLTIYFKSTRGGVTDTSAIDFVHSVNGQANLINRTPAGNYASYLANGTGEDDKIYIQSTPGSYAAIKIPGLETFQNSVIHRAEIIATRIPSAGDNIFSAPERLLIDRVNKTEDTAFILERDLVPSSTGTIDFNSFGGTLGSDNTYHFNISRYVQEIITNHISNDTLRMYAPLRSILFAKNLGTKISVPILSKIANGRVVLGGGNYADPALRLRLRIIYSKP